MNWQTCFKTQNGATPSALDLNLSDQVKTKRQKKFWSASFDDTLSIKQFHFHTHL